MSSLDFYLGQATKEAAAGDQAVLENVRDRCQRAAAAWSVLAAREKRSEDAREKRRLEVGERAAHEAKAADHEIGSD